MLALAAKSMRNRKATVLLTMLAIAVSTALLLGVEKVRTGARASFANTVSGTDLIVGARSGPVQLLLYSVFRVGNATNNISWRSYRAFADRPEVAWTIPLSLGDSHRGFRVLGTDKGYFEHFRYGRQRRLAFADGAPFDDLFDAVIGANVAATLGYELGDPIVIAHGLGAAGLMRHDDKPFRVAGVLAMTGTPVDRTVHVSLEAIEAIHVDWRQGRRSLGAAVGADEVRRMDLEPKAVTAVLIGLKSRLAAFAYQREVNEYPREPLLAVLPGAALQELWDLIGVAEGALSAISAAVVGAGLLGLLIMLLAGLGERRREIAILRSVGAGPGHVFMLLELEAALIAAAGAALGLGLLYLLLAAAQPLIEERFGLFIEIAAPTARDAALLGLICAAGVVAGAWPAWRASRQALADGMVVRT